ncbi:AAA family ATPase [Actinoplanes sp. N902-109]|uniref:ATP-binding protein n=1 Tax=Actinoplanes sp. (strain N902-109) TaxID=649831 RepID=UPI000329530F|nr:AAA family ATPase [Actinoplanes sp. N902-109]AGL18891.1 regulatory protein [Actinoplanes sp. N902-109]
MLDPCAAFSLSEPTFGRAAELAALHEALAQTAAGAGGCLTLGGPAGVGKSHLVRAAVELAAGLDIAVAAREAFKLDIAAPLVTLAGALRSCRPHTGLFDWLFDGSRRAEQYHTIDRLRAALEDFAAQRPLLIVIDDTQWMDELSALAVRELVPALASAPVRWLFAGRPQSEETPGLQTLAWLDRGHSERIELGVLDEPAVAQLSAAVVGAEVDNTVLALAGGCGGNPLRVGQLLRALRASRQLVLSQGTATVVGSELPSSFVDTVGEVLVNLSEGTQWLVRACSVFDRPFGIEAAARLTGRGPAEVYGQVEEALADILTEDGDGLAFTHDLVRQAIRNTLRRPVREQLHRDAAAIARAEGRPALEVAEHLRQSGRTGTADAVAMLREAAREVHAVAPATAADLMVHALQALPLHDQNRTAVVAEAVGLLAAAGRVSEARELGEDVLDAGLDAETEAELLLGLAEACKHAGQNDSAVEYATRGLDHEAISDALRARLYAIRAHALFYVDDLAGADESGAQAERIGIAGAEYAAAVFGGTARSLVAQARGRLAGQLRHAIAAERLAGQHGGRARQQHPGIWLANALTATDHFDQAEQVLSRGRRESERLGTAWTQPLWHYYYAQLLTARGRLDDADAEADAGVATAEKHTTAYQLAVPLLGTLARIAVLRGDLAAAKAHLGRMHELMDTGITAALEDVIWPEVLYLRACGTSDVAFSVAAGFYEALPHRPALLLYDPSAAGTLTGLALSAGDRNRAARVAEAAQTLATGNPDSHSAAGAAAHAAGLLNTDPGRLERAVTEFRRTPRRLALAAALQDAAAVSYHPGWHAEALTILTDCGAAGPQPSAQAPLFPELSPAEHKVALLVADGLTNIQTAERLFLSRHTVDSHLRHIFSKLGLKRRVELAALVARLTNGGPPPPL